MVERVGKERLWELLLAGTPDRILDALAQASPEDQAELKTLRDLASKLGASPPPVAPSPALRERLLQKSRPRPRKPKHPALLVCDMLRDHLEPGGPLEIPRARDIVPAVQERLANARKHEVPVVYVCDSHEPSDPDYRDWPTHALKGSKDAEVWPDIAPQPGDHIVQKRTYSAFVGSGLEKLLDQLGTDEIVLMGCATEVHLFATAVDALQRGFAVTIPPDAQAGLTKIAEQVTLAALSTMVPFEPRYLRDLQ